MSEMLQQPLPLLKSEPAMVATPVSVSAAPTGHATLVPLEPVNHVIGASMGGVLNMVSAPPPPPPPQHHLEAVAAVPEGLVMGVQTVPGINLEHLNGNSNDSTASQEV